MRSPQEELAALGPRLLLGAREERVEAAGTTLLELLPIAGVPLPRFVRRERPVEPRPARLIRDLFESTESIKSLQVCPSTAVEVTPAVLRIPVGSPVPEPSMIAVSIAIPMLFANWLETSRAAIPFESASSSSLRCVTPAALKIVETFCATVPTESGFVAASGTCSSVHRPRRRARPRSS